MNILYEHPLNERNRTLMRLEYLFNKIEHFLIRSTSWEAFIAMQTLIEIINILERNDISSELMKELDRYQVTLNKLLDVPAVNKNKLEATLVELKTQLRNMQSTSGRHSKQLKNDELLNSVRQRMALSSNLCSFDIPALYYWLHQNSEQQKQQFNKWLEELVNIKVSINLIMQIIRNSAVFETKTAICGFFQTALAHNSHHQIIRVRTSTTCAAFPEMSGNKHRLTVRFLAFAETTLRPQQITEDLQFELCCCSL